MKTLTIQGLKRKAKETNITILSIRKDKKYGGYMVKSYTSGDGWTSTTDEIYFEHLEAIDYMLNFNINPY